MLNRVLSWVTLLAAVFIVCFVLFVPPQPGVADQGDFQRVMDIAGLQDTNAVLSNDELRFFKYAKTEYLMSPVSPLRFLGIIPSPSLLYPIVLTKLICKMAGMAFFNTQILAAVYSLIYIIALYMCLRWAGIKQTIPFTFFSLLSLLILMDGNYLVWFNSLYGEPMMIAGLLLFAASILYVSKKEKPGYKEILFIVISSLLFLGSKAQCITAVPFVAIMLIRTVYHKKDTFQYHSQYNTNYHSWYSPRYPSLYRPFHMAAALRTTIPVILLLFYAWGIYFQQSQTCGVDTKYNAVFYGILKNSDSPKKDLEMLGLSGDLAVEAGKHAYLPQGDYVKYVPWSEITESEFNQKISNLKLIQFYLQNPERLLEGMKYTASQSFQTGTFLGKYRKSDISESTYAFKRFTLWSDFRSAFLPKNLWLIIFFFLTVIIVSMIEYVRKRGDRSFRLRIELLWAIIAIGTFQFPMPFVGNGEADTAKQLFLFNFVFDILVIIACTWIVNKIFFSHLEE